MAIGYTVAETIYVQKLLYDLDFISSTLVHLYCHNLSAMWMSVNPVQHGCSKHIDVDYHFVQKQVADGDIVIRYIPTRLQVIDIFIERLSSQQFLLHRTNLFVRTPDQIQRL